MASPLRPRDAHSVTDGQATESEAQRVDVDNSRLKERENYTTPLPKLQLSVLMYMTVAERINSRLTPPFIVQLIKDTGITGGDITKVGYFTGLVEAFAYFAEGVMVLQWGRLSDYIGRRPVLFAGLLSVCISSVCLGLSHSFWTIVASRAFAGAMNGNKGTVRCVLGELTDETNVARAFALLPPAWSVGSTIAPLIGGMLQHPYERFGGIFRHSEFWKMNPYFLPCIVTALLTSPALVVGFFFLKETAPRGTWRNLMRWKRGTQYTKINDDPESSTPLTERSPLLPARTPPSLRELLTPSVLTVVVNWAIFGGIDISFDVLQPLILATPITNGGLGMSPAVIGTCLSGFGIVKGASSILFFPWLFKKVGPKRLNTVCIASLFGSYLLFPVMNALARTDGEVTPIVWAVFLLQLALAALPNMAYSCLYIYLTAAAAPSALGATNGVAQSATSITRCVGPASATALYALSMRRNLLGGNLIYVVMCSLVVAATMTSLLLPEKPWDREEEEE